MKRNRKENCKHEYRDHTYTYTEWYEVGFAYKVHRACRKCSLIQWSYTLKSPKDTPENRNIILNWIKDNH